LTSSDFIFFGVGFVGLLQQTITKQETMPEESN
jgi:hypothetical protein